jgi:hypothetical protein
MFKRWKAARKLSKFRNINPRQNIDESGNVIIDECHMVCFINDEYPPEHQMLALTDAASTWMFKYASTQESMKWNERRSNPVVLKVGSSYELERILKSGYLATNISTSYFAGEIVAICIGPVWNSRLEEYRLYEKITYE